MASMPSLDIASDPIVKIRWKKKDDRLLARLVGLHGTRWQRVLEDFNRKSSTKRSHKALWSRWRIIAADYANAQSVVAASSSKNQATPPRRTTASVSQPAASTGHSTGYFWTEKEVDVLRQSLVQHGSKKGSTRRLVHHEFFAAFPTSLRSLNAIDHKCRQILPPEEEHDDEDEDSEDEAASGEDIPTSVAGAPAPRQTDTASSAVPHGPHRGSHLQNHTQATSSEHTNATPSAAWPAVHTTSYVTPPRHSHPARPISEATADDSAADVDVGVIHENGGLIIEDCPKLYEVRVFSPKYVRIARQRSSVASTSSVLQQPAFHFQLRKDGSIDAITVPPGTTTNMAAVPADGYGGAVGVGGMVVETRWTGPDGYFVTFRAAL